MKERPQLYIIPIAHTYADMGSIRGKVPFNEKYEITITRYWIEIFRYLSSLPSDLFANLQIYQDGLINAPREIVNKIVDETQTANCEVLRWLKRKGATVIGTENANLIMEEYQALQTIANCPNGDIKKNTIVSEYLKKSSWLLEERDKYIAQRIRETLPEGKTGLLFIGAAHDVGSLLTNEIHVSMPEMVSRALPNVLRSFYGLMEKRK